MKLRKKDIKSYTLKELQAEIGRFGEPVYRAKQIFSWLYQKGASDFSQVTNLPGALRDKLGLNYSLSSLELAEHLTSTDGTEKFLFKLQDGNFIETVLITANNRKTICISTQVGCKFACSFCASGVGGFVRNLAPSEMTNQILYLKHNLRRRLTNYVFMGMGEPLDNCDNLLKTLIIMTEAHGMAIGAGRITVSTCGIVPGIQRLRDSHLRVNLSVSLHASNNKLRDELLPINKRYPFGTLISACQDFARETRTKLTLEYVLMKDKNDSLRDADGLAGVARTLNAKVNLIPCSSVDGLAFAAPEKRKTGRFIQRLITRGINVTLRESKGEDIKASCGLLAGRKKSEIQAHNS